MSEVFFPFQVYPFLLACSVYKFHSQFSGSKLRKHFFIRNEPDHEPEIVLD